MKKKTFLTFVCMIALLFAITGCGAEESESNGNNSSNSSTAAESKAKCGDVLQCMEKLDVNSELDDMNEVMGFEAKEKSSTDDYKIYEWDLTDDTSIEVMFNYYTSVITNETTVSAKFTANYPWDTVPNKADFSKWDEIEERLNSDEGLSYSEFVELVGGVEGTIDFKSDDEIGYSWHNSEGNYLNARVDPETNEILWATGRF